MKKINHHSYNLPGITDNAVLKAQAERRRDKLGETTIVHDHQHDRSRNLCTAECLIFEPGYKTRSIATERTPMEEDES